MTGLKILHVADCHLDRPFVGLAREAAEDRRRGLRAAVERALAAAAEHDVDVITIGGDLWEDEHVRPDTRAFLAGALERCGVPVLIVAGNHDPLLPGGVYDRTAWPANAHVFPPGSLSEFPLGDLSIWGASWGAEPLRIADALATFRVPDDGRRHILLIHGTSDGHGFADEGAPGSFTASAVRDAGFALALVGHIHAGSVRDGVVYPGSPEPLNRKETGTHAVALIDDADVTLLPINAWHYADVEATCDGAASSADVERTVVSALPERRSRELIVRLTLTGTVASGCEIDVGLLTDMHGAELGGLEVIDATVRPYDVDLLASRPTALGRFVTSMQARIDAADGEAERQVAELALHLGVAAMNAEAVLPRVD